MLTFHPNTDFPNEQIYILFIIATLRNYNLPLLESDCNCGIVFTFYAFLHAEKWHNFLSINIPLAQKVKCLSLSCVSITTGYLFLAVLWAGKSSTKEPLPREDLPIVSFHPQR